MSWEHYILNHEYCFLLYINYKVNIKYENFIYSYKKNKMVLWVFNMDIKGLHGVK